MAAGNRTEYTLSSSKAAALRVPKINYPGGVVPLDSIKRCLPPGCNVEKDMPVDAVLELIKMQGDKK